MSLVDSRSVSAVAQIVAVITVLNQPGSAAKFRRCELDGHLIGIGSVRDCRIDRLLVCLASVEISTTLKSVCPSLSLGNVLEVVSDERHSRKLQSPVSGRNIHDRSYSSSRSRPLLTAKAVVAGRPAMSRGSGSSSTSKPRMRYSVPAAQ